MDLEKNADKVMKKLDGLEKLSLNMSYGGSNETKSKAPPGHPDGSVTATDDKEVKGKDQAEREPT